MPFCILGIVSHHSLFSCWYFIELPLYLFRNVKQPFLEHKTACFALQDNGFWNSKWLCLNLLHTFLFIVTELVYTFFTCFLNSFTPPWKLYWFALHSHKLWQWSPNVCSTCSKLIFFLQLTKFNTMKSTETLMPHCCAFPSFVLA